MKAVFMRGPSRCSNGSHEITSCKHERFYKTTCSSNERNQKGWKFFF
jgi:hypothetical protein